MPKRLQDAIYLLSNGVSGEVTAQAASKYWPCPAQLSTMITY